jgi:AcrR family transcriptional regulator
MPRPSRNVDELLIRAAHQLLPQTGVRGLSLRRVAEHAGVNLGMFHYHFKTKDVFIRAVLEDTYNDMFAKFSLKAKSGATAVDNLGACLTVLARFCRDNRELIVRLMGDALAGEVVAVEFMQNNIPRHLGVIAGLIAQAQKEGALKPLPVQQALAFVMGAVADPIFAGTAVINTGHLPAPLRKGFEIFVFTDAAIGERIDMALAGMATAKQSGGRK